MSKAAYLKELKIILKNVLPEKEIKDIISDYNEYFDTGLSEGKTEMELEQEFGSPGKVLEELINDREISFPERMNYRVKFLFQNKKISFQILSVLLFLICLFYSIHYPVYDMIFAIILPLLLIFSDPISLINTKNKIPEKMVVTILFILSIPVLIGLLVYDALHLEGTIAKQLNGIAFEFSILINLLFIILFLFTVWILLSSNQHNHPNWLFFYLFGALMTVLNIQHALSNIQSFDQLHQNIYRGLYPFALGSMLSFVVMVIIRAVQKNHNR